MVWKRYRNITQPELSLSRNVWGGSTTTWPKRRRGGRRYWRHRASSLPAHLVNHEPHLEPPAPHSKYCELFWSAGTVDCDYRKLKTRRGRSSFDICLSFCLFSDVLLLSQWKSCCLLTIWQLQSTGLHSGDIYVIILMHSINRYTMWTKL